MKLDHQKLMFDNYNYFNTMPVFEAGDLEVTVAEAIVSSLSPIRIYQTVVVTMPDDIHTEIIGLIAEHVRYPIDRYDKSPIYQKAHNEQAFPKMGGVKKNSKTWNERVEAGVRMVNAEMLSTGIQTAVDDLNEAVARLLGQNNKNIYEMAMKSVVGDGGKKWMLKEHPELQEEEEDLHRQRMQLKLAKANHRVAINQALLNDMRRDGWEVNERELPALFQAELEGQLVRNGAFGDNHPFGGL